MIKVEHALLGLVTLFGREIPIKAVLRKRDYLPSIFGVFIDDKMTNLFTYC
jgi:hypothetical protein